MTEEQHEPEPEPRITNTQKEKDPRKVLAGKKLGAISKMAKNHKAERNAREVKDGAKGEGDSQNLENNNYSNTTFYASVFAAVVVGCLGIIYVTKRPKYTLSPEPPDKRPAVPDRGFHSNLISLDD